MVDDKPIPAPVDPAADRERVRRHFHDPDAYDYSRFRATAARDRAEWAARCFAKLLPDPVGGRTVLEVGAGTGRYTRLMLGGGFQVTATDVNVEMVQFLEGELASHAAAGACRVERADVFALPYGDGAFDGVVCMSLIGRFGAVRDQRAALAELRRVVRPEGWLVFNMRNPRSLFSLARGKGGLSDGALRRAAPKMELAIERRQPVHFVDGRTFRRWPEWRARLAVRIDRLAAHIPGLPAHNLLYRARRITAPKASKVAAATEIPRP